MTLKIILNSTFLCSGILLFSQDLEALEKNVIEVSAKEIKELMNKSDKEYQLLYSYASWCKPCMEIIDQVLKLSKKDKIAFYPVVLDKLGSRYLEQTLKSLYIERGYTGKTYKPSAEYSKRYYKSYEKFVEDLIPSATKYGISFFVLFDKQGSVLYKSTYEIPKSESIKKIDALTD